MEKRQERMRPLLIGPEQKAEIKRVMDYAQAHPYNIHQLYRIVGGREQPPGDNPEFVCLIPIGYRCVFTIEQQQGGWMRHLSVSVNKLGVYPNEHALEMLAAEFGFKHKLHDCKWHIDIEEHVQAVNVLELLEDKAG
jgi:hypothetical protein